MDNAEQIKYWNEDAAPKWVAMQESLDAQLEAFNEDLIALAQIAPGMRVVDIGCGCGASTLHVAKHIGPEGYAHGVDVSRPMLDRAADRAKAAHMAHVRFEFGDAAEHTPGEEKFDAAISRFGSMFFVDPLKAFINIRSWIAPGGRVAFLVWRPIMENPWMAVPLGAVAGILELPPPPEDPYAPGPFALADAERTASIFREAGYDEVDIVPVNKKLQIGAGGSIDAGIDFIMRGVGPISRLLEEAPPETEAAVHGAIREAVQPHTTDEGIMFDFAAWMITARNS